MELAFFTSDGIISVLVRGCYETKQNKNNNIRIWKSSSLQLILENNLTPCVYNNKSLWSKFVIHLVIDFSINNKFENANITTDPKHYKIKVNWQIWWILAIRIELTRTILTPRFSNFLRNLTIHFRMYLYLVTCLLFVSCRPQGRTISSRFTN